MFKRQRVLLSAGFVLTVCCFTNPSRAADDIFKKAAREGAELKTTDADQDEALPSEDEIDNSSAGNGERCRGRQREKRGCLEKLGRWLCYRSTPVPCDCKGHFTPYRPPLYAWFPCRSGQCGGAGEGGSCMHPVAQSQMRDPELPATIVPRITKQEKPLIPGSSAAMADRMPTTIPSAPKPFVYPQPSPEAPEFRRVTAETPSYPSKSNSSDSGK